MLKIYKSSKGRWQLPFGVAMLVFLVSFTPERALSQTKTIRGTVTESPTNIPLPGVSVRVKGTQTGTTTSANGNYTIMAKPTDVIVFTFLGLKTQEITVGTKTTINVALAGDATSLSEVVVIGYGTVAKPDLTGSVGVVPVDDMAKAPVGSFADALAGRVAGVKVNATDGQPGSSPNIVIRGAGSLTQSTSPLYVIDGFPVEDPDPEAINPEEIESMTILKDASSTAIYGSRGANGVILITTKRGKVGKPVVTVSSSLGFQSAPEPVELMSPYEFVKYQTELNPNVSTTLAYFGFDKTLGRQ
ncbi:MAG TPA: TonB-dependent receptor plug domain-containing protein, partial [Sphingobacteriaceae bacterium]